MTCVGSAAVAMALDLVLTLQPLGLSGSFRDTQPLNKAAYSLRIPYAALSRPRTHSSSASGVHSFRTARFRIIWGMLIATSDLTNGSLHPGKDVGAIGNTGLASSSR